MGPLSGDRDKDPILNGRTDEYIADLYEAMAVHEGKVEARINDKFGQLYGGNSKTLKYPEDMQIGKDSDYIKFGFYQYEPPYERGQAGSGGGDPFRGSSYKDYNQNANPDEIDGNFGEKVGSDILLFMPQDVSTSYGAEWGGKEVSNFGAGTLSALTNAGNADVRKFLENMGAGLKGISGLPITVGGAMTKKALEMARTNLTLNDILGGTEGVILNPNVELFFSGHKIRNFGLKFKMSARTPEEAMDIISICNTFKVHSLPQFGGRDDSNAASTTGTGTSNFIKIPNLVKMEFMKGSDKHPFLSQYKAMALTNVDINYTPDGSYSTLIGGLPTAVELSIAMVETKLVYQNDFTAERQGLGWSY